jgi:hypothetical protein
MTRKVAGCPFFVTLRRKPKGLILFCHFEGGQSPEESLIAGFKEKKEERWGFFGCLRNLRMTIKESQNDTFLCHPEGFSPKGLLRGFFGC